MEMVGYRVGAGGGAFGVYLAPLQVALQPYTDIKEKGVTDDSAPWI